MFYYLCSVLCVLCSLVSARAVCELSLRHTLSRRQTADRILGRISAMNFDFGLVVEAREDNTLPERVLMSVHLEQLDVRNAEGWGT